MKVMWVDDEIEGLKPHIMFLEREGIEVVPFDRPEEAINALMLQSFDLVLLDFRMPGMDGLTAFRKMKKIAPHIPIALVTMVTDKDVIEESVSEDVYDYIVKPVQPSQVLALVKRISAQQIKERFKGKKMAMAYSELHRLPPDYKGWLERARILAEWSANEGPEFWQDERTALNHEFANWIENEYIETLHNTDYLWSHNVLDRVILPELENKRVVLFLFDNFRMDQFVKLMKDLPHPLRVSQMLYMSILPTATPYARNSFYSGLLPYDIERRHSGWTMDNTHERELLEEHLLDRKLNHVRFTVYKVNSLKDFRTMKYGRSDFEVFSINFIDLLSHLRMNVQSLHDLTPDESAFMRWAEYVVKEANLNEKITKLLESGYTVFLTTDHGWVEGKSTVVVEGGGELTPGLRFKFGDSVRTRDRGAVLLQNLKEYGLPTNRGSRLLLAITDHYFVYPSDVRRFEKTYYGGIYHGGISIEEMCLMLVKIER